MPRNKTKLFSHLFLLVLLACAGNPVFSQQKHPQWVSKFKNFNDQNKLPSSETYVVYNDRNGLIWILTDQGIVKYDGYRFQKFTIQDGLVDNVNFKLVEAKDGNIWFLGYNGLFTIYTPSTKKFTGYKYNYKIKNIISRDKVASVCFSISEHNKLNYGQHIFQNFEITDKGKVHYTHLKHSNRLVLSRVNGELFPFFDHYNDATEMIKLYNERTSFYYMSEEGERELGQLLVGRDYRTVKHKGIDFFLENKSIFAYYGNKIQYFKDYGIAISIYSDANFLYVGFYKQGLIKFKWDSKKHTLIRVHSVLNNFSVSSMCSDKDGGVWYSTLENGVYYDPTPYLKIMSTKSGLKYNEIQSIVGERNNVTLTIHNGRWRQLYSPYLVADLGFDNTYSTPVYFRNKLYVSKTKKFALKWKNTNSDYYFSASYCTDSSLFLFGEALIEVKSNKDSVIIGLEDRLRNSVWSSTNFYIRPNGVVYSINPLGTTKIYRDRNGGLKSVRVFENESVNCLFYSKKWGAVLGCKNGRVLCVDGDEINHTIDHKKGLFGEKITKISDDKNGRLWVITDEGVNMITGNPKSFDIQVFSKFNGLNTNNVNGIYAYKDSLWLATKRGVVKTKISSYLKQLKTPKVQLESKTFFFNNKAVFSKDNVFTADVDLIIFKFSTSNYNFSENHIFKYRFKTNGSWIITKNPEIIFSQPSWGKYKFELSIKTPNSTWSKTKTYAVFEIKKPFYISNTALLIYTLLLSLVVFLIVKMVVASNNKKNEFTNYVKGLESRALVAQMNPHFIFNSLNSIHSFLLFDENENAEKYLLRFSKLIRKTLTNSRQSVITISDELEILENYIQLERMRYKSSFTYVIEADLSQLPSQEIIPPMLIQPYVENAIIHGLATRHENGEIRLFMYKKENSLIVEIMDNGIGYDVARNMKKNFAHRSFGTQITEERLKSLAGKNQDVFSISIKQLELSDEFPGTLVTLVLPIS